MAPAPSPSPLEGPWISYRTWAQTAAYHKKVLDKLTTGSLYCAIAGAILAAIGQQLVPQTPVEGLMMYALKAPGILGACLVALSAYLAGQAVANDRIKTWTKARAAAESLKSGIYLYRASAPPFDGADRGTQMASRVHKLLEELKGIEPRPHDNKAVPSLSLTVDQYIAERVDDQVAFYEKRAGEHQAKADRYRKITAVLGGISALLALGLTVLPISAWAAVIATITTSITAHLKNQQYQTLVASYVATATRLRTLKSEWAANRKTEADTADRNLFLQRCEETMATENGAWAAMWMEKPA